MRTGQNYTKDHSYSGIDYGSFHAWLPNWGRCAAYTHSD